MSLRMKFVKDFRSTINHIRDDLNKSRVEAWQAKHREMTKRQKSMDKRIVHKDERISLLSRVDEDSDNEGNGDKSGKVDKPTWDRQEQQVLMVQQDEIINEMGDVVIRIGEYANNINAEIKIQGGYVILCTQYFYLVLF